MNLNKTKPKPEQNLINISLSLSVSELARSEPPRSRLVLSRGRRIVSRSDVKSTFTKWVMRKVHKVVDKFTFTEWVHEAVFNQRCPRIRDV